MQKILYFLIIILCGNMETVYPQASFSIKGKVNKVSSGLIYLKYTSKENKYVKDSSQIANNGNFSFRGEVSEPTLASLQLKGESNGENEATFFIESSAMTAILDTGSLSAAKFTGSKTQNEFALLDKLKKPVVKEMEPLTKEYNTASEAYRKAVKNKEDEKTLSLLLEKAELTREKFEPYNAKFDYIDFKFFGNHPHSFVTAYILRYHVAHLAFDILEKYYIKFGPKLQQSRYGKEIKEEIDMLRGGSPGAVAKNFSRTDINGDTLALSFYKGNKYVLLDFWASWCVPCRKGNPHLKEIYLTYKEKGLEIIGVSDDDNSPDKWKKAVVQDNLPWRHILRGIDWEKIRKEEKNENDINEKFGIHVLPTKILINKNGVIIGRYNEEEDDKLDAKLKEIFAD